MPEVSVENVAARVSDFLAHHVRTQIWSHVSVTEVPEDWSYPENVLVLVVRSEEHTSESRTLQIALESDLGDYFEVVLTVANVLQEALGSNYGRSAYFDRVALHGVVVRGDPLDSLR